MRVEETFFKMCLDHDLTYQYSDDHAYWTRGTKSRDAIKVFASQHLTKEQAATIWNAVVDLKILESERRQFYWR